MPVIAVVAAVGIDSFAVAGGIAAMSTLTAITAIGATLGAIGAVTGNKTLGLIGAGLGLVGGIGTLAAGSGALGTVGDLFGSTTGSAGAASGAVDSLGVAGGAATGDGVDALGVAGGAAGPAAASGSGSGIINAAGSINPAAFDPANAINSSLAGAEGNTAAAVTGGNTAGVVGQSLSAPTASSTAANANVLTTTPVNSLMPDQMPFLTDAMKSDGTMATGGGLMNWAHNNPLLSYGVLQAGGSFITGLTNPMTPAQINALNSQANANNAAAALSQREAQNMGQSLPSATVTGIPAPTGGLINNSRVGTPLITGTPNTGAPTTTGVAA